MILKIKQRQHVYETKGGWKWDFIGAVLCTLLFTGIGVAFLCWGLFGEPKAKPGRTVDIPPRTAVFLAAGVLIPLGLCLGGVEELDGHRVLEAARADVAPAISFCAR
jgi:hypothetical protein